METKGKRLEVMLETVCGGIKAPESKYNLNAKVRFIAYSGEEMVGVIYDEVYYDNEQCWYYLIRSSDGTTFGSFSEESILGLA